ncbi:MAG: TIGR04283 family arsenosugar biosynthesis glycosyltransferase [Deltaproteobacteria bacterium]|nr:TIGR04283 family arsenosugar biosynthesis glycosyltransferase [Deltaproteobacteria bacterium]
MRQRIIIFGRYPFPGKVKTRLVPLLGPAGAADLQRELTEATLRIVTRFVASSERESAFCFEGGNKDKVLNWLGRGILLSEQEKGDLGRRMRDAFQKAFQDGCRRVVLLGTDIPGLTQGRLQEAFRMLREKDVVLGPSTDGGYWLVGMNRPLDIFEGMTWGDDTVLDQTLKVVRGKSLRYHLLKPLMDVDTIEDLQEWNPRLVQMRPYLSVIIPALNEENNIRETIAGARDQDAEIIVVDGGSRDRTRAVAEEAGAKVVATMKGRALQQNAGAASAKGKVLLFLHADTLLPARYVDHVFETLLPRRTAAGAFRFKTDCRVPLIRAVEWMTNVRSRVFQLPYGDQALFMKKALFNSVGGFPHVSLAEDFLLVRLLRAYGRIRIAEAEVLTSGRRWQRLGVVRTTLINWVIMAGCHLGVSPDTLAPLYLVPKKGRKN